MQEILRTSLFSHLLMATEIADPTLPFIIIGCVILAAVLFAFRRSRRQERRLKKNILPDTTLDFESEVGRQKRELSKYFQSERYNYASGFIPGAEPELSFIDPARRPEPIEVITTKETYHPTAEPLEERPSSATVRTYPTKAYARISAPLKLSEDTRVAPPALSPEIDVTSIKKPEITAVPEVKDMTEKQVPAATEPAEEKKAKATKTPAPTRAEKRAAKRAAKTAPAAIPAVAAAAITDTAPKVPKDDVKAPKIALAPSVKKVVKNSAAPKDTHRVVITAVPVAYAKPPRKDTKNEFKVSVEKTADISADE